MKREEFTKGKYRMLSLDGGYVYDQMHPQDGRPAGIHIRNEKGEINFKRFEGFLDFSLETEKLRSVYAKHRDVMKERFEMKSSFNDFATMAIISLSFDEPHKKYYRVPGKEGMVFVRSGYTVDFEKDLSDHVCVREEQGVPKLIAIELAFDAEDTEGMRIYTPVQKPILRQLLPRFFDYDSERMAYVRRYNQKRNSYESIDSDKTRYEVRELIYRKGFDCDGVHYVRYKRSAGSSREGHCLFMAEPLYAEMAEWSACGLDPDKVSDRAAWEAYTALTLSSIEKIVKIPKKAILLLPDVKSVFREPSVICVEERKNLPFDIPVSTQEGEAKLVAQECPSEITNTIWDGEALLDESVFAEYGYAEKGMMLLRNRFFKTCAFHTKLQKWFADHGITHLRQLNGYTCGARSVSDIKLVITESSLKYLKMYQGEGERETRLRAAFEAWCDQLENGFGVVKTDKKTNHMYGRMVSTNYQMLNTIPMNRQEVKELLAPSLEYLTSILSDPVYMRHYINYLLRLEGEEEIEDRFEEGEDETAMEGDEQDGIEDVDVALLNYRKRVVLELMARSDKFTQTEFYSKFRTDMRKAFLKKLQMGRILVNGTYATLFGNGAELLHATIDKEYTKEPARYAPYTVALKGDEICTTRFPDGARLLGVRSPHVTMGNLLMAKNCHKNVYRDYFNLTDEIVCVNAIKHNIQYRLNGCDYDSDTMLLTDNPLLLKKAGEHYRDFAVPVCALQPKGNQEYANTPEGLAGLDDTIANNMIGSIINMSQYYNSLYWDKYFKGGERDHALYRDICKLAVMSGMEIDKAKRMYPVETDAELAELGKLRAAYRAEKDGDPLFYQFVTKGGRCKLPKVLEPSVDCPMEYAFCHAKGFARRAPRIKELLPLGALLKKEEAEGGNNDSKYKKDIMEIVNRAQKELNRLQRVLQFKKRMKKAARASQVNTAAEMEKMAMTIEQCIKDVSRKIKTPRVIYLLVKELDKEEKKTNDKRRSGGKSFHSLLLASLCFSEPHNFYHMIEAARDHVMYDLERDVQGDELIYGIAHMRVAKRRAHAEKK